MWWCVRCVSMCVCVCLCLCAQSCLTCWDPVGLACQSPLSMKFSRQEYWSGLLFPTPGDLFNPGIEPESLASSALAGRFFTTVPATWETQGGMQHSQFTWAQNPFFLNISRIRVLWNTIFSNGMFIFNDFKFFIKGGLLARNTQVTVLRGLKDWLCDSLLSLLESTPRLSAFYLTRYCSEKPTSCLALFPQPSHSLLLIKDGKHGKEVTRNVTEQWQVHWHDGKFLGLIWRAAGSDSTPWISWVNSDPWHIHRPECLFYQVGCFLSFCLYTGLMKAAVRDVAKTFQTPALAPWIFLVCKHPF